MTVPDTAPAPVQHPVDILYILGPGHCGSTLLNLCLDRHSEIAGVSEIVGLNRQAPGWSGPNNVLDTPFWAQVDAELQARSRFRLADVPLDLGAVQAAELPLALEQNKAALGAILTVAGKRIVADASKDVPRLDALLASEHFRVRVIYLVRDGRAVVHAYRRKYGGWSRGYRKLMHIDSAARSMAERHGTSGWLTIRYEDLATDPERTLRGVCEFAGVRFEPAVLSPDTSSFNGLGGNRLRRRPVDRISLDKAWKTEMPGVMRALTGMAVRQFNGRYGYTG